MKPLSPGALCRAASAGMCQREIAEALAVSKTTLKTRMASEPDLRRAWEEGRKIAARRWAKALRRPLRSERQFALNLHVDLATRILVRAHERGVTAHAIIVDAVEKLFQSA